MGRHLVSPIVVLAAGIAWRAFGTRGAGEKLTAAMAADDEQNRMLAGMSLVKAGQRSFDFIERKIEAGEASSPLIRLLPDIGGPKTRTVLDKIVAEGRGELVDTARQCIERLDDNE